MVDARQWFTEGKQTLCFSDLVPFVIVRFVIIV